jgi:HAD superfamily hydrolase (TIGR01509 family)
MNGNKLQVDAVLFDLDGTLIDSIGIYFKIVDIIFERLNLPPVSREAIVEAVRDGDFDWNSVLPDDVEDRKDKIISDAVEIIYEIYPRMFGKDLRLISGADRVLETIACDGLRIGLVTSTPQQGMDYKMQPLKKAGVDRLFEAIITTDDIQNKKPAAEPLIECLKRLQVDANRSVYVGDTRVDIKAGKSAGMKTIGVLTGFDDRPALEEEAPDAIIQSVRDLPNIITTNFITRGIIDDIETD